jgi:uncharacterized membrane protein YdjX (TVP38/TMEM64 family)
VFIVGLVLGPVVGLLTGDYFFGSHGPGPVLSAAAVLLLVAFLLFAPFFALDLKSGLILGVLVGVLLSATPMSVDGEVEAV